MTFRDAIDKAAAEYLRKLIKSTRTMTEAARKARVHRTYLYDLCHRHGVVLPARPQANRGRWL